jgi:hypothetical protein
MLDQFWSSNSNLELFTDSAGGIGFGIYFNHMWAQACWPKDWEEIGILSDIAFLELFFVVAFRIYISHRWDGMAQGS